MAGTHHDEKYRLPIDQQSWDKMKDDLLPRPQLEVSTRDLCKSSWTGADAEERCEFETY